MIVALVGASCTGKSTVEEIFRNIYKFSKVISYTTRSPRSGEENHKDYHFISATEFEIMKEQGIFAEWDHYSQGRMYGSAVEDYQEKDIICVLTPHGVRQLKKSGLDVKTIYITCGLKERVMRYLSRLTEFTIEDLHEVCDRAERDFGMFNGFEYEADLVIENNGKLSAETVAKMLTIKIGVKI